MKYEIKHRLTGAILFSLECGSLKLCVEAAVMSCADLRGADLSGADLSGADLSGTDLSCADLRGADLSGANFDVAPATTEQAIQNLDKVREIILDNAALLEMGYWHEEKSEWQKHTCAEEAVCGTTHCLAGWLQVCSTDPKIREMEPELAGTLCAPVAAKMFFKQNTEVLEWLDKREYAR